MDVRLLAVSLMRGVVCGEWLKGKNGVPSMHAVGWEVKKLTAGFVPAFTSWRFEESKSALNVYLETYTKC